MIHLESRCLNVPIDALPSNKNWFCESLATQKRGIQTMCCTPQTASRFTIGVQHPPPLDHIERSWMKLSKNLATTSLYYTVDFFRLQKSNLPVDHVLPWNETTLLWTHMLIVLSNGFAKLWALGELGNGWQMTEHEQPEIFWYLAWNVFLITKLRVLALLLSLCVWRVRTMRLLECVL